MTINLAPPQLLVLRKLHVIASPKDEGGHQHCAVQGLHLRSKVDFIQAACVTYKVFLTFCERRAGCWAAAQMAAPLGLKPAHSVHGSCKASFRGLTSSLQKLSLGGSAERRQRLSVQAGRVCDLTGKKANNGYTVTFSHKRIKKLQGVNLQYKKVFWPEEKRWVRLRISTKAMKTVERKGLQAMAKEAGLDLYSLPYTDARPQRLEWLAQQPVNPPMSQTRVGKSRRMKNPEKLAASKKKPLVARYILGNRVILTRDPAYVPEYAN